MSRIQSGREPDAIDSREVAIRNICREPRPTRVAEFFVEMERERRHRKFEKSLLLH